MAKTRRRQASDEPLPCCNFAVAIDGISGGFYAVSPVSVVGGHLSGLGFKLPRTPRELEKVGPEVVSQLPTVILRRGMTRSRDLFRWRQNILNRKSDFRTVEVQLLDGPGGDAVNRWVLKYCWPTRWTGASLDAMSNDVGYEELELCYLRVAWR